jgi:hypothetical protein
VESTQEEEEKEQIKGLEARQIVVVKGDEAEGNMKCTTI